ncbi:MAG: HXXEE domain-containing protein [Patescibacteria group bacterium]
MNLLEQFFVIGLLTQFIHAIEELATGFNKKWYVFKMPFWVFLVFEVVFESFWIAVWFLQDFPSRTNLQAFFLALMFANGVQHIVWAGNAKKYVPGLITAPIHIIVFLVFYFKAIF